MSVFLVHNSQVGYGIIPDLLEQGVGVGGAVCKTFGCNMVDHNWDEFNVYSVMQVGSKSMFGIIINDSQTLGLDNLESEVAGGTCGTSDRVDLS